MGKGKKTTLQFWIWCSLFSQKNFPKENEKLNADEQPFRNSCNKEHCFLGSQTRRNPGEPNASSIRFPSFSQTKTNRPRTVMKNPSPKTKSSSFLFPSFFSHNNTLHTKPNFHFPRNRKKMWDSRVGTFIFRYILRVGCELRKAKETQKQQQNKRQVLHEFTLQTTSDWWVHFILNSTQHIEKTGWF